MVYMVYYDLVPSRPNYVKYFQEIFQMTLSNS